MTYCLDTKNAGSAWGSGTGWAGRSRKGESIEDSARRETFEEVGVRVGKLNRFGIIQCDYRNVEKPGVIEIHLFDTSDFTGEPVETEEIKPAWYKIAEYPFDQAWPDDRFWVPWYLKGKTFRGRFVFEGYDRVVEHELTEGF